MIDIKEIEKLNLIDIELLKEAGQKVVYKAISKQYGKVVLKVIKPNQNIERVLREIEILKSLKEINSSQVLEDGKITSDGSEYLYIIESFIEGQELREYMSSHDTLSFDEVCKFLQDMITTIEILEQNHLVHRDIKPENIIRTDNRQYILIDFGIARDLSRSSLTATDAQFGPATYIYAPIEQIDNEKDNIDSRVDLYSVCLVAYEMLSGINPFAEGCDDILQAIRKVDQGKFPPLTENSYYSELIEFIHTNMNRYKTRRTSSAKEAKEWIDDIAHKLCKE